MAWIRLSDNYIDNPKFLALSAAAFRLWHEGMAFCRKHQTDGAIPTSALCGFRYYKPSWATELSLPYQAGANPLWTPTTTGYEVHDYLAWNPSKAEENERRADTKERMRISRERRRDTDRAPVRDAVTPITRPVSVPDRIGIKSLSEEEKSDDIAMRAGRLVENYGEWYREHRKGARHFARPNLDWHDAHGLCKTWDDDRLKKLATIILTTDDPFISGTDRGFKIFVMKATWADDRLRQWETENGVAV